MPLSMNLNCRPTNLIGPSVATCEFSRLICPNFPFRLLFAESNGWYDVVAVMSKSMDRPVAGLVPTPPYRRLCG